MTKFGKPLKTNRRNSTFNSRRPLAMNKIIILAFLLLFINLICAKPAHKKGIESNEIQIGIQKRYHPTLVSSLFSG